HRGAGTPCGPLHRAVRPAAHRGKMRDCAERPRAMAETMSYAVFLYPQAIELLGNPIKPYLREASGGAHIVCAEIDASGALFEMTLIGQGPKGERLQLEIMLPVSMVKMVMSMHGEQEIGFV